MRLVVLTESPSAAPDGYDVQLGPLSFVTPADSLSEPVGDGVEAVGAAIVAGEREPRPLRLQLPVRGYHLDQDPRASGLRLRRQVRQVFNNAGWRLGGFYFLWDADPDMDGWLICGKANLIENDAGVTFGEWDMELDSVFLVGRPGTHRPGRRAIVRDRRTGLVERDTRRLLYSTDFDTEDLPGEPLVIPGDVVDLVATGNSPVSSASAGPLRGARRLWREVAAEDAEIVSYLPDEALLVDRDRYIQLDELGAVRVWNLENASPYPPDPAGYTASRDTSPNVYWGWERVLGDMLTPNEPLAVDNGACRLIWLGPAGGQGLAIEYWDDNEEHFVRAGRVLHSLGVREQRVVEVTPERAVIEWRAGRYAMRAILQRGWWGPRLESYDDGGQNTRLEFAPTAGATVTVDDQTPAWVREVTTDDPDQPAMLWASGSNDENTGTSPTVISGPAATWSRTRVLVAQLAAPPGPPAADLAALSLVDARAVPVLVGRR